MCPLNNNDAKVQQIDTNIILIACNNRPKTDSSITKK